MIENRKFAVCQLVLLLFDLTAPLAATRTCHAARSHAALPAVSGNYMTKFICCNKYHNYSI